MRATTIEVTKVVDKQSGNLLFAVNDGKVFATGRVLIPIPKHNDEYLELLLHDAVITSDHVMSNGPKYPLEDLTLKVLAVSIQNVSRDQLGDEGAADDDHRARLESRDQHAVDERRRVLEASSANFYGSAPSSAHGARTGSRRRARGS